MTTRKTSLFSIILILAFSLSACGLKTAATPTALPTQAVQTEVPTQPSAPAVSSNPALGSLSAYQTALEDIYQKVNPSVVNIQVTTKSMASSSYSTQNPFAGVPGFQFFFGSPSMPDQQTPSQPSQALGSGFVWNKDGYIVTNNHVIANADTIKVKFADGTTAFAKVVGTDVNSDLAVIQLVDYTGPLTPITTSESTDVKVGQVAIAIGNPYGLENTMTVGIVSALGRTLPTDQTANNSTTYTIPDIIQTDAPINPGNSGGVLVNDQGELIGVTAAIESSSGANAGIGFAIPSSTVNKVVPELIKSGKFEHAYLGITGATLNSDLAAAMKMDANQRGVLVVAVAAGGPADKAGLLAGNKNFKLNGQSINIGGDIITAIDGQKLTSMDDLISYLSSSTVVGQNVKLTVLRNGSESTVEATLTARPTTMETVSSQETGRSQTNPNSSAYLGVAVTPLNSEIAAAMNLSADQKGLLVEQVESGSPADLAGMVGSYKPIIINMKRVMIGGDIITAIDNEPLTTLADLQQVLSTKQPGQSVSISILRDGTEMQASVTLAEKTIH